MQPLGNSSFRKLKMKHCKVTYWIELDTGSGIAKIAVEFNLTLDQ